MGRIIKFLCGLLKSKTQKSQQSNNILAFKKHRIKLKLLDRHAIKIITKLNSAGYQAFLVGGCLRDISLGLEPKDFDVATNAYPEQVKALFPNCYIIGRRFKLAHIRFGHKIIEVATFRSDNSCAKVSAEGMLLQDNSYGSIEEDVLRRDFTINALYYSPKDEKLFDFVGGWQDLQNKVVRLIGDPELRYREDPVRILRAIRFAAKLDAQLTAETVKPFVACKQLLKQVNPGRLYEEYLKLFNGGYAGMVMGLLLKYELFEYLFPLTKQDIGCELWVNALANTDQRAKNNQSISPGFLIAVFLWPAMLRELQKHAASQQNVDVWKQSAYNVLRQQKQVFSLPNYVSMFVEKVWLWQNKLVKHKTKSKDRLCKYLLQDKFRAGYDFLCLRALSKEPKMQGFASWWGKFIDENN